MMGKELTEMLKEQGVEADKILEAYLRGVSAGVEWIEERRKIITIEEIKGIVQEEVKRAIAKEGEKLTPTTLIG